MVHFYGAYNQFTGTLESFNHLTHLKRLDLAHNQLQGQLPDFSGLTQLEYLNLSHNQFCGQIPQALIQLPQVNLTHNQLTVNDIMQAQWQLTPQIAPSNCQ